VSAKGEDLLAGLGVPEFNVVVAASGEDSAAVGGEGDRGDGRGVAFESPEQFARFGVVEIGAIVFTSGDDGGAVGAEGGVKNGPLVSLEDVDGLLGGDVPYSGGSVVRGRDGKSAVGGIVGLLNAGRVTGQASVEQFAGGGVPESCLAVVAGGEEELRRRPCTFTTDNPVAPLHHDRDQVEGALLYAEYGIPIDVTSEPQAGATAPVTIAGLLAQQTADVISGITIIQLKNPGNPVWYGTCGSVMDMRVGRIAIGAVEMGVINVASAQIAHSYDIPCRGTASATDSKELDFQAGYEKTAVMTMAVLGGVNKIFYPGTMEGALTVSKEGLVLDNEIAGAIYHVLDGVDVVDDTLGVGLAQTVGPGGHYLNQRHTMQFIRQEHFLPLLADRQIRERWEQAGEKNMVAKAHEEVTRILEEHHVEPLPEGTEEELKRIVREVEKREETREAKRT